MLIKVFCCLLCWPPVAHVFYIVLILKFIYSPMSVPPCYLNSSCSMLMFVRGVLVLYLAVSFVLQPRISRSDSGL
jgi:hypothetical protein